MASTLSYPGVYIQELPSAVHPITGVATSICAFVGYTSRGIDNRPEQIFSFSDYTRLFGGIDSLSELSYAVQQFFANGGTQAWVVRVPRTEATGASVTFNGMTFTALSSGSWADFELLVDVDFNSVSDTNSFNLTFTNLSDGTVEVFPNVTVDATKSNYYMNIVNDPDNGSQLVKVGGTPAVARPAVTGVVSVPIIVANMNNLLSGGSTVLTGTVTTAYGSKQIQGSGTAFNTEVKPGNWIQFAGDLTETLYQVSSISGTTLMLTTPYTGVVLTGVAGAISHTISGSQDFGLSMAVAFPSTPLAPFPLDVKVFPKNSPLPQTVTGLAAQLQKALNSALSIQMPGASATCTVAVTTTSGVVTAQAICVSALLPQYPDAIVTFGAPSAASGLSDVTVPLGISFTASGSTSNVAHYALGTVHDATMVPPWGSPNVQTASTGGSDGSGLPGTADLIGAQTLPPTGIYALEGIDLFNLLCIPDATRAMASNPSVLDPTVDPNSIYSAAIGLCYTKRAFLIIDCPPAVNTVSAAMDWKTSGLAVADPDGYSGAYFPRLRLPDPANKYQLRTFAPCGVVAGLYARTDTTRGVWKAPAGTEASLNGVQSLVYKLSDAEQGVLNPLGLNCFRTFPVYGSVLWGARTTAGADANTSQWKYVPVRRVALFLETSLYQGTQWVVFEPNDEPLWSAIRLNIGSFMQNLFIQGYFQGKTPADAYFVKCDSETTTQTDIDNGVVNIVVGFAPLEPAEFVVIQIQQMSGQTAN